MPYHQQALWMSDPYGRPTEIFNAARLVRNLDASGLCGSRFGNTLTNAGCDGLLYQPGCPSVLSEAYLWLDAEDGNKTAQTAPNRGLAGPILNAIYGAGTAVGTDEPLWLGGAGSYLYTPAVVGNFASTPDTAALKVTGDIEMIMRVAMDDWTPAAIMTLMSKYTAGTSGYELQLDVAGTLTASFRVGAANVTATSSVATGFLDGSTWWVRCTRASASGNVNFYYAPDADDAIPTSWSQLGTANVATTAGAIVSGTTQFQLGERPAGSQSAGGKFYRAVLRTVIGATTPANVLDVDFTAIPSTVAAQTTYITNGYTWTINRAANARKSVVYTGRPLWLFGTDDFMSTADADVMDFAANESFTMLAIIRQHNNAPGAIERIFGKHSSTTANAGWDLAMSSGGSTSLFTIADGTNTSAVSTGSRTVSAISVIAGVRNVVTDQISGYNSGVAAAPSTDTTTTTLANSVTIDYGRNSSATSFMNAEAFAFMVFKRALTAAEIAEVSRYYAAAPTFAGYNWTAVDFTTNPWYNGSTASTEAFGFFVEQWTGLDGAQHSREVAPSGQRKGGAYFGPMTDSGRTMKMNVLLHGSSERGLEYLFRWLEQTLLNCCDPCGWQTAWIREFCPTDATVDPNEGVARLERVALIEGPTWEAEPVPDGSCYLRRVSFTLVAGDPCMYREPISNGSGISTLASITPVSSLTPASCAKWQGTNLRVQGDLTIPQYGSAAPILRILSPGESTGSTRKSLPVLRIAGYADPNLTDDPCRGNLLGELVLEGSGSSGLELLVDMAQRRVLYRTTPGGGPWLDGSRFIGRALKSNVRRWWSVEQCANGYFICEPAFENLLTSRIDPTSYSTCVSTWMVTAYSGARFGCC